MDGRYGKVIIHEKSLLERSVVECVDTTVLIFSLLVCRYDLN